MTLYTIVETFKKMALEAPNIHYADDGDVLTLSSKKGVEYGVFFITQNPHKGDEDHNIYSLNLFYIDRLVDGAKNRLQVQSDGIVALRNIINRFNDEIYEADVLFDITYTPFDYRFADECSGVYATVTIIANNDTVCPE